MSGEQHDSDANSITFAHKCKFSILLIKIFVQVSVVYISIRSTSIFINADIAWNVFVIRFSSVESLSQAIKYDFLMDLFSYCFTRTFQHRPMKIPVCITISFGSIVVSLSIPRPILSVPFCKNKPAKSKCQNNNNEMV